MLDRRSILKGLAILGPALTVPARLMAEGADRATYGMIEIGASGLKVAAYRFAPMAIAQDDGVGISGRERVMLGAEQFGKSYQINTSPISKLDKDRVQTAELAAQAVLRLMGPDYRVPRSNICIVASSGVAVVPGVIERLGPLILEKTQQALALSGNGTVEGGIPMDAIDAEAESRLSFDWIVYAQRRRQVLLIDIGSGNTKGGYYENVGTCEQRFRGFAVPFGTKTLGNAIRDRWPNTQAAAHADEQFAGVVVPALNAEIESAPGMVSKPRVYLAGGIIWATAMLTRPEAMVSKANWVRLQSEDFEQLHRAIAGGKPYQYAGQLALPQKQRDWLDLQLTKVAETFNDDQLATGNAICRGLARRLNLAQRSALYFPTFAVNAWSSQYLLTKFRADAAETGISSKPRNCART